MVARYHTLTRLRIQATDGGVPPSSFLPSFTIRTSSGSAHPAPAQHRPRIVCQINGDTGTSTTGTKPPQKERGSKGRAKTETKEKRTVRRSWPKPWLPGWGWDGTADEDMGTLESWLREEGMPPQKVTLDPVQEGERGLVARQAVGKGETILYVPEKLIITARTVYSCPHIGPLLQEARVPEWPAFAVYLLSEAARGDDSTWQPYIEALPQNPGCILMWSLEEVDAYLEGSPVRQRALECIAEVTDTFKDLEAALFSKHRDVFPSEIFTLGAFKWAFSILFSRMVRLPSKDGLLALVPWADMLNHKCDVGAYLDFDPLSKSVVFKTDQAYEQGQQVYVSYGPRPNGDLLVAYGMVPTGRNPNNSVEVQLGAGSEDPLRDIKQRLLLEKGLSSPQRFPVRMEGMPTQMMAYARLLAAGPETSSEALAEMAVAASSSSSRPLLQQGGPKAAMEVEIGARELLVAACQVALNAYPTSLEEDEALSSLDASGVAREQGAYQERAAAAAALRASERRILFRTDATLRAELKDLRNQSEKQDGRSRVELGNNFGGRGIINDILKKITNPW